MASSKTVSGIIFNIQHFSVHDGRGIRTLVFFKGCPLRCRWCSNPESQKRNPELAFKQGVCLTQEHCQLCAEVCSHGGIHFDSDDRAYVDRNICGSFVCGMECAHACPSKALMTFGRRVTVDEILADVHKDSEFYGRSSGGVTVSGGEPLSQPDFLHALLQKAGEQHLDTTIETSLFCDYASLKRIVPCLDMLICDFKHPDSEIHKQYTGVRNERIIENLLAVVREFPQLPVLIRTPVIPGFNDKQKIIEKIIDTIEHLPENVTYELLPYHRLGAQKYTFLGRVYPMKDASLQEGVMEELNKYAVDRLGSRLITVDSD